MTVSLAFSSIPPLEQNPERDKSPLEDVVDVPSLTNTVGLHNWNVREISSDCQAKFQKARQVLVKMISEGGTSESECASALDLLNRIFVLDPATGETAHNLINTLQELGKLFDETSIASFVALRPNLIETYSLGIQCYLSNIGQRTVSVAVLPKEVQKSLLKGPEFLKKLHGEDPLEIKFHADYALEGIRRMVTEDDLKTFKSMLRALVPLGGSLIGTIVSAATLDSKGLIEGVHDLYDQYTKEAQLHPENWYEEAYILRRLGTNGLRYEQTSSIIAAIGKFILKRSGQKLGLLKAAVHPHTWKTFSNKECSWKIFLSAAQAYKHILFHYAGSDESVYENAFKSLLELPTLSKNTINHEKVCKGVAELLTKVLEKKVDERLSPDHRKSLFEQILTFGDSLKAGSYKENLLNQIEESLRRNAPQASSFAVRDNPSHKELFLNTLTFEQSKIDRAIERGAHPTYYVGQNGNTALHIALERGKGLFRQFLDRLEEDPSCLKIANEAGETPMSLAINKCCEDNSYRFDYIKVIDEIYPQEEFKNTREAFHNAVKRGELEVVKIFLKHGQRVNEALEGCTALDCAMESNQFEIADFLIDSGADEQNIERLFQRFFGEEKLEKIQFFLEKGLHKKEREEGTLFFEAIDKGLFKVAEMLVKEDWVKIDLIPPNEEYNALHKAIADKNQRTIEFLLNLGARRVHTRSGRSCEELAGENPTIKRLVTMFPLERARRARRIV